MSTGVPIDRFLSDAPTRDKVTLEIERRVGDEWSIHLAVPLRAEDPDEHALQVTTGQPTLRVHYKLTRGSGPSGGAGGAARPWNFRLQM